MNEKKVNILRIKEYDVFERKNEINDKEKKLINKNIAGTSFGWIKYMDLDNTP